MRARCTENRDGRFVFVFSTLQEEVIAEDLESLYRAVRDLSIRYGRHVDSFCIQGIALFLVGNRSLRGSLVHEEN